MGKAVRHENAGGNLQPPDCGEFASYGRWRIYSLRIAENCRQRPRRFKSNVFIGLDLTLRRSRIRSPSSFRYGAVGRAPFSVRKIIKIIHSARTISNAFRDVGILPHRSYSSSRYAVEPGSIDFGFYVHQDIGIKVKNLWIPAQRHTGKTRGYCIPGRLRSTA